ncbi:MAG: hypothetical protein HND39_16855 [Ignavibacteriota bacterium]|nr:MAG: hypothetical protein HND39_16855 [Ignavibacteriota bacterium]
MREKYRKGGIGAVMDEYERAAAEFKNMIENISDSNFIKIVDTETKDDDCRSVQTIVSHVTNSGFGYANYIRDWYSIPKNSPERKLLTKVEFMSRFDNILPTHLKHLKGNGNILMKKFKK